jgi:RNA polymerase sigma-70 factor, ECF subfamily
VKSERTVGHQEIMTETSNSADDRLLRRMMAGDEEAFALLYQQRHPAIYRFALHMSGSASVAEDVTQEVFMALIRDPKRFDPKRGTLNGFLFGIARNHLRKRWEIDRRTVSLAFGAEDGDDFASPFQAGGNNNGHGEAPVHEEFASLETIARVRQAISTLPLNYREAVILCELEEMSYDQAATALGCPVGTVRSRLHRGRAMLLEKLREGRLAPRASAVGE